MTSRIAGLDGAALGGLRRLSRAHRRVRRRREDGAGPRADPLRRCPSQAPVARGQGKTLTLMITPVRDRVPVYLAVLGPRNLRRLARVQADAGSACSSPPSMPRAAGGADRRPPPNDVRRPHRVRRRDDGADPSRRRCRGMRRRVGRFRRRAVGIPCRGGAGPGALPARRKGSRPCRVHPPDEPHRAGAPGDPQDAGLRRRRRHRIEDQTVRRVHRGCVGILRAAALTPCDPGESIVGVGS